VLYYALLFFIPAGICVLVLYGVLRGMRWLWEHSH